MPDLRHESPEHQPEPSTDTGHGAGGDDAGALKGHRVTSVTVPPWLVGLAGIGWRVLVVAAAVLMVVVIMAQLYLVLLPVFLAILATSLLAPPADWLRRRRWPAALAASVVVVGALGVVLGGIALLVPPAVQELADVGAEIADGGEEVLNWLVQGPLDMAPEEVDALLDQGIEQARANVDVITTGLLTGAVVAVEMLAGLLITLVLTFFFVKDGDVITGWLRARAPAARREELGAVSRRAWATLSGYIRGLSIVAFVDAVGIGLGLAIIGVPLVLPLMVLTFIGGFFPVIGATVAGAVAVLIALVSGGPVDALLVAAVVVAVQQMESNLLQPVVMGRAVRLHPVVVLLAITAGAVLGGIVGAFLAVPAAAVAAAVGNELRLRADASWQPG